jgi:alpha-amylase
MNRNSLALVLAGALALGCGSSGGGADAGAPDASAPDAGYVPGTPVKVSVGSAFPAGTALRDAYGGGSPVTVASDGTVTVTPGPSGLVLLEKDGAAASAWNWADATVYHVIVDRYKNGDTSNDHSFGRKGDGQMEVGTWHGGDWKGLTSKLDYLADLGVSAIWISPIVEQAHGWVGGGSGDFRHWGYHGYWALDFTKLDPNFGTEDDLHALVDAAHAKGLRVLVDVVINHPGYATGQDLLDYLPEVFKDGTGDAFKAYDATATTKFHDWNNFVDFQSTSWPMWWGPQWMRAGLRGYPAPGSTDQTMSVSSLPDFITEGTAAVDPPVFLGRKPDTNFVAQDGFTVRQYLVKWQTDWVRKFGFDGFRCDTAKNVEVGSWKALKDAGVQALADWKAANPQKKLDDAPFWMTGEVFSHSVQKDSYYTDGGFDSLINFTFQSSASAVLDASSDIVGAVSQLDGVYTYMAATNADPTFGILSYASSHDTRLSYAFAGYDAKKQRGTGTLLLLAPGGVEIFYGDESGRHAGPGLSDATAGTRSDMNFDSIDDGIFQHWRKLARFRRDHAAVGAGAHTKLTSPVGTYSFSRTLASDAVVVIITPSH